MVDSARSLKHAAAPPITAAARGHSRRRSGPPSDRSPEATKGRAKPDLTDLTCDQIEEIKQRRADGETTTGIAAVMELDREVVAQAMSDGRNGKGERRKQNTASFHDKVARLVAQGCSVGDIQVAFPSASEREIEEAVAWAQR